MIEIIRANNLSAFNLNQKNDAHFLDDRRSDRNDRHKTSVRSKNSEFFKTKDAREVMARVVQDVSKNFTFSDTSNLFGCFNPTENVQEIIERQNFVKNISKEVENNSFAEIRIGKKTWRPPYSVIVVTEDEKDYMSLQKSGCPVKLILNDQDVKDLEDMDVVQVLNCENYNMALERLPQTVFLNSVDEAYLEKYVETLSQWKEIIFKLNSMKLESEFRKVVNEVNNLMHLTNSKKSEKISVERVNEALQEIREDIAKIVKEMTISGSSLVEVISKGLIPEELKIVVSKAIQKTGLPSELFFKTLPVTIDEHELNKLMRKQEFKEFSSVAEKIKLNSKNLVKLPEKLKLIDEYLLIHDFKAGIKSWCSDKTDFPMISETFHLEESYNLFLKNPQGIKFNLDTENKCSILTGANSGGKTTLLEHALQIVSCLHLGLPMKGLSKSPLFSEVYYFAKNKGSMSKGAFETLLTQMSEIKPGKKTLILADEIEAVTEPGVAGKMICATVDYFVKKNCFMIVATHLGQEIVQNLPEFARVDGIEAKGLSEENELIVDHNPVLGKLANSTPELIIEKMAKSIGGDYFNFLHQNIVKNKSKK